jgi:Fe-S-cluster-containing dehydrogenase component
MHRVKKGKEPACVEICPTKALAFGDLSDEASPVSALLRRRSHKTLKPELGLRPKLFFLRNRKG